MLYLYALLGEEPQGKLRGLSGEPVEAVACLGFWTAVGTVATTPPPTPAALARHDRVVRRLARGAAAVLPARFGSVAAGRAQLERELRPQAKALRRALALVKGCEQMTLRAYRRAPARRATATPLAVAAERPVRRSGREYLEQRRELLRLPEPRHPLRQALGSLLVAERVEPHATPPLLASVYHLVPRGAAARYRTRLRRVAPRLAVRLRWSGPWPPYAFAPEAGS